MEKFLKIFNETFNKLNLIGVSYLGSYKNMSGRTYYKFIGKFEFDSPLYFFENNNAEVLFNEKEKILNSLQHISNNESNCIRHKFTKKIRQNGNVKIKKDFNFVFDIVPKNIIDFEFDKENNKIIFYVVGYGI